MTGLDGDRPRSGWSGGKPSGERRGPGRPGFGGGIRARAASDLADRRPAWGGPGRAAGPAVRAAAVGRPAGRPPGGPPRAAQAKAVSRRC